MQARLREVRDGVKEKGANFFSATVERLEKQPSPERPPAPLEGTYDGMLLSLLRRTADDVKNLGLASGDPKLDEELVKSLDQHLRRMPEFLEKAKEDLAQEEAEQKKKITSDDIRPGFSSSVRTNPARYGLWLIGPVITVRSFETRTCPSPWCLRSHGNKEEDQKD